MKYDGRDFRLRDFRDRRYHRLRVFLANVTVNPQIVASVKGEMDGFNLKPRLPDFLKRDGKTFVPKQEHALKTVFFY
jgi:hypothetical protein